MVRVSSFINPCPYSDDPQLRTSLVSREVSSALNLWTSSAHNPSGLAPRSSPKLFPVSTFLLVRSGTGARVRKTKSPRQRTPSSSLLALVRSVYGSRAKSFIGRVASARVRSMTARSPSSGTNLWLLSVVAIPLPRRLHANPHAVTIFFTSHNCFSADLAKYGSHVYVFVRRGELRASKIMAKRLMNDPKIVSRSLHISFSSPNSTITTHFSHDQPPPRRSFGTPSRLNVKVTATSSTTSASRA